MNWKKVEQRLRDASTEAIRAFARDHPAETFYGFCFDCNADYGEVGLSLNTEEDLWAHAASHYPSYSQREVEGELRWSSGDWKYTGFNTDPPYAKAWEAAWEETQEAIHGAYIDDENAGVPRRFLESVCRVLIAMEKDGGLEPISRAEGFKTLVTDHNETNEDSWARLLRVRNRRRS
jgi:hypothetical protein